MPYEISLHEVSLTGWNPRKIFDDTGLDELKRSIQEHGILEPLIVRPFNGGYQLVAGERRYRAAKELGLEMVPVVIKELDDRTVKEIMLLENLQREDLNPLEEATALQELLQDGITQEELGRKLGKSQAWIANRLRLLQAPQDLKDMLISREITPKHVITLLPFVKYKVCRTIIGKLKEELREGNVSVKRLEKIIEHEIAYGEYTLCIDDLKWELLKLKHYIDLSGCEACEHTVTYKNYADEEKHYCLNHRCWKDRVNKARQKYEKQKEKLIEKGFIDTSELSYDDYDFLGSVEWDKSECETCDKRRITTHHSEICLDPRCFRKKQSAWTREQNKAAREESRKAYETLDRWLEQKTQLGTSEYKTIIKLLSRLLWATSVKKALKPWGKIEPHEQRENIVDRIPDKELPKALLRLVIVTALEQEPNPDLQKLKAILGVVGGVE